MLFNPAGQQETVIPYKEDYGKSQVRLTETERKLVREIYEKLIDSGSIHNSMILGAKALKADEVLKALLKRAAGGKKDDIGTLFGRYLYIAFMEHKEKWIFKRNSKATGPGGLTYWRDDHTEAKAEE